MGEQQSLSSSLEDDRKVVRVALRARGREPLEHMKILGKTVSGPGGYRYCSARDFCRSALKNISIFCSHTFLLTQLLFMTYILASAPQLTPGDDI